MKRYSILYFVGGVVLLLVLLLAPAKRRIRAVEIIYCGLPNPLSMMDCYLSWEEDDQ